MIRPKIKRIYSTDISDIENFCPENPENFSVHLRLMIGPQDSTGEESFDINICTPNWINENLISREGMVFGYQMFIVKNYVFSKIKERLDLFCNGCTGSSWGECALKLSRIAFWEFEDYKR
jgi:hypothetical protein